MHVSQVFKGRRKTIGTSRSFDETDRSTIGAGVLGTIGAGAAGTARPATICETSDDILAKYRGKKEESQQPSGDEAISERSAAAQS